MSTVTKFADYQQKTLTKLVCSDCGAPGQGSCNCGAPYVTPGERAEAAVKANPEKSDRAIAEEIGVNNATVSRARKRTTVADATVAKRTGKDGKTRKQPTRRTPANKFGAAAQARQRGKTQPEAAKEAGLGSVQGVKIADAEDQAVAKFIEELGIDPTTLSMTATAKLEVAKRVQERALNAEHAARVREVDEEVRQRVLKETKEYLAMLKDREVEAEKTIAFYREFTNNRKPLFTIDEFKAILMCLHPDSLHSRTVETLNTAFRLFNNKKVQLTGEK